MISDMVYSVYAHSRPPKLRCTMRGSPRALWRVWWVMV